MTRPRLVKCVVWDLDGTVWEGTLLEGDEVRVRSGIEDVLRGLDERGILNSIASRNDPVAATAKLRELGLDELFVHPQIRWDAKSGSVAEVARLLGIGTDALAFVDDDPFERDEVAAAVEGVLLFDAREAAGLLERPELRPPVVSEEARRRRVLVRAEAARARAEQELAPAAFLASLGMVFTVGEAEEGDLARVEELTLRTNQLNSTGTTYTAEELEALRTSPTHRLLVASLEDRYGDYGKIGLAVVELGASAWTLHLLLMSCRVLARGVGRVLLTHVLQEARRAGVPVRAAFVRTPRNRPTYLTFKFAGFRERGRDGDRLLLEHDLEQIDPIPPHVELRVLRPGVAVHDR